MPSSNQHRLTIYIFYCPLIVGRKKLLLLRRATQTHRFPGYEEVLGGRAQQDEAPRAAALRELREEIGLSGLLPFLLLRHFKDMPYGDNNVNHVYYMVMWWKPRIDISKNPDPEHDDHAWRSFQEIHQMQLAYRHKDIFHELLATLHWKESSP